MPITVPVVGQPTYQSWAKSVADSLNAPKRFSLWRAASWSLPADGANTMLFDGWDDPYAMLPNLSVFKAPVAGIVQFNAGLIFGMTGPGATFTAYTSIMKGGVEQARGVQHQGNSATFPQVGSVVSAALVVAANDQFSLQAFCSAAGVTKTVFGGKAVAYWMGCYIGTSY